MCLVYTLTYADVKLELYALQNLKISKLIYCTFCIKYTKWLKISGTEVSDILILLTSFDKRMPVLVPYFIQSFTFTLNWEF